MSIKSILGGDILATDFFKRQTNLLILIMILTIFYINKSRVFYNNFDGDRIDEIEKAHADVFLAAFKELIG